MLVSLAQIVFDSWFTLLLILAAYALGFGCGAIDTLNWMDRRSARTLAQEEVEP